jgi:hypothetical protein
MKIDKSRAQLAAEMVDLSVHEGLIAAARAMGLSLDSATPHISY